MERARSAAPTQVPRPCIDCGAPGHWAHGRCPDHERSDNRRHRGEHRPDYPSNRERGYGPAWRRLSARARRAQPWCQDCGARTDLTLDHLPGAWERVAAGKPLRLGVDVEVCCRACNSRRGGQRRGL